jgi:hypothetical protein
MRSSWSDSEIEAALTATLRPGTAPAGSVDRMLASLPSRMPAPAWWRQRRLRYALAVAAAAIALMVAASPAARDAIASTIQQVFYYFPGQGIRGTEPNSRVLAHPVSVARDGVTLRVLSVLAGGESTAVAYEVTGLPGGKNGDIGSPKAQPGYLVDPSGHRYQVRSSESGAGGTPTETRVSGTLFFEPLPGGVQHVSVVIDSYGLSIPNPIAAQLGAWRVPLDLLSPDAAQLRPADLTYNTVTLHGVSIRLNQLERLPDRVVAHVSGWGARLTSLGSLTLAPDLQVLSGSGSGGTFDFEFPPGTQTIRIDQVEGIEPGTATVYLAIPPDGSFAINKTVRIGEYEAVLERGRWVNDSNGHSLYISFRAPKAVDGGHLIGWDLEGIGSYGVSWDAAGQVGQLMVTDAPTGHVRLRFKDPRVVIDGPWELPLK